MDHFEGVLANVVSEMWGWPMLILLFGTHVLLTIRLRFPQRYIFKAIGLSFRKDKNSAGDVSPFEALATALAATIGTGNIIGVATAITLGGPGAVFWCWVSGIFGIATKYGECVLAVKYRVQTCDGTMLGGPMYALEKGLKSKWLAIMFAVFTALAALGIGNTVQANAISVLLNESYGLSPYISGAVIASLIGLVILFGVKGIARLCGKLVPFMAVTYVIGCIWILIVNAPYLGDTISLIFSSAFTPQAAGGGFVGATVIMAARFGIARGLFSNESGLGSASIVAAAAQSRNSVRQGLISSTGTFWDTVVICALTGLVIVSSIIAHPEIDSTHGATLTKMAFSKIPYIGEHLILIGLVTFAFSTILGWTYYAEKSVEYLGGKRAIKGYRVFWLITIFIGSTANLPLVWNIADGMNALMAIPNLISLIFLSGVIVKETRYYLWSNNLDEYSDSDITKI